MHGNTASVLDYGLKRFSRAESREISHDVPRRQKVAGGCPVVQDRVDQMAKKITIAHSPDSDDAFMFWGMSHGKVSTGDFEVDYVLADIETLNQRAEQGVYEVTALSIHAYAYVADKYALLPCGASMGDGYGPIVVARPSSEGLPLENLTFGVPGIHTTAFLALELLHPGLKHKVLPFDEIMDAVLAGDVDAGLVIHEGQLTYVDQGLVKLFDLGEEWLEETGLPLPLGGNGIRKDVPKEERRQIAKILKNSIQYGLDNREVALRYAEQFGRGIGSERADEFVSMYVNELTLSYGKRGERAIEELLKQAVAKGLIPQMPEIEFV